MKFKCLILDHDDTAVDSTAAIHYPAHCEIMKQLRPNHEVVSLDGWFRKNYEPGIYDYYTGELGFTEKELEVEYNLWREFTLTRTPDFYNGFLEMLALYKRQGGRVTVVSHSDIDVIKKHYDHHGGGADVNPEIIHGWNADKKKRKPHPYPVLDILSCLNLSPEDVLIVDDLKPGVEMAQAAGVKVAAAGWGHNVEEISSDMRESCDYYFGSVDELSDFLFE